MSIAELEQLNLQTPIEHLPDTIWDVVIVGAGPAGAYAGICLAKKGLKPLLIDSCAFPRDKPCGDGLIADSLKCLDKVGLLETVQSLSFTTNSLQVYSPSGHHVAIKGQFLTLKRRYLDTLIVQEAVRAGCRLLQGTVQSIVSSPDHNQLEIAGTSTAVKARVAVIATGATITLAQKQNLVTRRQPSGVAIRGYLRSKYRLDDLVISYDRSILPGYAWIFPLTNNEYNVGCGAFYRNEHDTMRLKEVFKTFMAEFPIAKELLAQGEMISPLHGCPLRCGLTGTTYGNGGSLLVTGETIGTTFPFTGEGIGKAMEVGEMAATVIEEALAKNDFALLNSYTSLINGLHPRYDGYKLAEKWCSNRYFLDYATKLAAKDAKMQEALNGVVNETVDLREKFTFTNALKIWLRN